MVTQEHGSKSCCNCAPPDEEKELLRRLRAERSARRMAQRCQLVLWCAQGKSSSTPGTFSLYPTQASSLNQVEI